MFLSQYWKFQIVFENNILSVIQIIVYLLVTYCLKKLKAKIPIKILTDTKKLFLTLFIISFTS